MMKAWSDMKDERESRDCEKESDFLTFPELNQYIDDESLIWHDEGWKGKYGLCAHNANANLDHKLTMAPLLILLEQVARTYMII